MRESLSILYVHRRYSRKEALLLASKPASIHPPPPMSFLFTSEQAITSRLDTAVIQPLNMHALSSRD